MAEKPEHKTKRLEIRKYPNRRYYDVTRSQHLTLEDIRNLVQEGNDIRVTDSKTSADITAKILAQIILELDDEKIEVFPVSLLTRLIRVNDRLVEDFMEHYFDQALSMFIQYRQQLEEQMRGGDGLGAFYSSLANWNRAMMNPFAMPLMGGLGGAQGTPPAAPPPREGEAGELETRLKTMQEQLAIVEAKLASAGRRKAGKRKRGKG
jgi:polyhydroxyalkanoate synthesis repressor PhaR